MNIVVINKNQEDKIDLIENKIHEFSHVFCFDRYKPETTVPAVYNTEGTGFLAGKCRDIGAAYFDYKGDFLFLDGDKVPEGDLNVIPEIGAGCVLLGVGKNDHRRFMRQENITKEYNWDEGFDCKNPLNFVYSCGIYLSQKAVDLMREINGGRIFHPCFDGTWGDEDRWIGDVLGFYKIPIFYTTKVILSGHITSTRDDPMSEKAQNLHINMMKRIHLRQEKLGLQF